MDKKVTLATLKAFVRRNEGRLLIKERSYFDGMIDGAAYIENPRFVPAEPTTSHPRNTLGIAGAWVLSSRNRISRSTEGDLTIFKIDNCWGSFELAAVEQKP